MSDKSFEVRTVRDINRYQDNKDKKPSAWDRVKAFINRDSNYKDLMKQFDLSRSLPYTRRISERVDQSFSRDLPDMLQDPIISSCLAIIMETAFQVTDDQEVFRVNSNFTSIKDELDKFHQDVNMSSYVLSIAYTLLVWGNLPIRLYYNEAGELYRFTFINNIKSVVPIIVSNKCLGYFYENEYFEPHHFVFAQLQYYKDLVSNSTTQPYSLSMSNGHSIFNEFVLSSSYLIGAYKAWTTVNTIEDALLLQRIDQQNYMRIIGVKVGGEVTSKNAIKLMSFYRQILAKARRVPGTNNSISGGKLGSAFEVIIPLSDSQDLEVKDIGGQVEVKALKDLEIAYKRLFASLRTNPSHIGFSENVPSSLGESPSTRWDERFARTTKTLVYAVSRVIKEIDYFYLRSRGYEVNKDDWSYLFQSGSTIEEDEKLKNQKSQLESLKGVVDFLDTANVKYDKSYLLDTLLRNVLKNYPIDIDYLFRDNAETLSIKSHLKRIEDLKKPSNRAIMDISHLSTWRDLGVLTEEEYQVNAGSIKSKKNIIPYKDYLLSNAFYSEDDFIIKLDSIEYMDLDKSQFKPITHNAMLPVGICYSDVKEISSKALSGGIDIEIPNIYLMGNGKYFIEAEYIPQYLKLLEDGNNEFLVKKVWSMKNG